MSGRTHRGPSFRTAFALSVTLAVAGTLAGCDSNDDDGDSALAPGPGPDEPGESAAAATTFAQVIALGANDEPLDLDAEALAGDLAGRFGATGDEPLDIEDGETIDELDRRKRAREM